MNTSEEVRIKLGLLLKGASLATLTIAGILLAMAHNGNPIVVAASAAALAGWIMAGNAVVQAIEFVVVEPDEHAKWFAAYKVLSLVASVMTALFLLTALVADPKVAMNFSIVTIFLTAIIDGVEAWYLFR